MDSQDEGLAFAGPTELAELVRARKVHPRELVELALRRIEALNPALNAFRTVFAEEALAEAEQKSVDGALAGVPIAIKSDTAVAGQATTRGSRTYGPAEPADAEVVRRLRAAGAIPIGITNVPELIIWPWTASAATGITRNPWDTTRTPGGSSGGSAAAVAAGLVPCATGSDGGGSIRIPASCCGLVGMKPTRGRVSMLPLGEHWLGLSTLGPLARTVRDSALLLDVMQGATDGDTDRVAPYPGRYVDAAVAAPGRLRVAISRKIPGEVVASLSADKRQAWEATAKLLTDLGHEVTERDPAYGTAGLQWSQTWLRGIHDDTRRVPEPDRLERTTRQMGGLGRLLVRDRRAAKLRGAMRARTTERILRLWDHVDVLVTPALARTPIAAEGGYGKHALLAFNIAGRFTPYTAVFNLTGQPAVTIPAGFGTDGLPLSVQLVGRPGEEHILYALAGQIEAARPWAEWRPPSSG